MRFTITIRSRFVRFSSGGTAAAQTSVFDGSQSGHPGGSGGIKNLWGEQRRKVQVYATLAAKFQQSLTAASHSASL